MAEFDTVQVISLIGALLILGSYAANQAGVLSPNRTLYNAANLIGALVLAWVAVLGSQYGFIVLEGTWAAISLVALVRNRTRAEHSDGKEDAAAR